MRSASSRRCTSPPRSASPTATRRCAGCTSRGRGRTPARASPACCSARRSPRGWSTPTSGSGGWCVSDAVLAEGGATTHRVARTFSLACRMLPRGVRDDVYGVYQVLRTLDDVVDEGRPEVRLRLAALEAWCRGDPA